jgi:hypothetical protein
MSGFIPRRFYAVKRGSQPLGERFALDPLHGDERLVAVVRQALTHGGVTARGELREDFAVAETRARSPGHYFDPAFFFHSSHARL